MLKICMENLPYVENLHEKYSVCRKIVWKIFVCRKFAWKIFCVSKIRLKNLPACQELFEIFLIRLKNLSVCRKFAWKFPVCQKIEVLRYFFSFKLWTRVASDVEIKRKQSDTKKKRQILWANIFIHCDPIQYGLYLHIWKF
jgi:hypothetical protein